jgi:hypothetical protein
MRGISNHQIKVTLWGVGAFLLRGLLWVMIGINMLATLLVTWTNLTVNAVAPWSVGVMIVVAVMMLLCESVDRALTT